MFRTKHGNLTCSSPQRTFKFPKKGQSKALAPKGHNGSVCSVLKQRHKAVFLPFAKESAKLVILLMGETQQKAVSRRISYEMHRQKFLFLLQTLL